MLASISKRELLRITGKFEVDPVSAVLDLAWASTFVSALLGYLSAFLYYIGKAMTITIREWVAMSYKRGRRWETRLGTVQSRDMPQCFKLFSGVSINQEFAKVVCVRHSVVEIELKSTFPWQYTKLLCA